MKLLQKMKVYLCCFLIVSLLPIAAWEPVFAENERASETGVVVTNNKEFMAALAERKSPVIISGVVTVGDRADTNGRMLPIMIPQETIIRGETAESILCTRAPLQLEGDGVLFQNMKMQFESSNALGSVVHREIFLAGHSLTLDRVGTYLDGGDGEFGDLGGTEKELLPTVCAGGFPNTSVGNNASLTVKNTEREQEKRSMFQNIYMSHEAGSDGNVPYTGTAELHLDSAVLVREKIFADRNSSAEVSVSGSGIFSEMKLYGNSNTTLQIRQSTVEHAVAENVGSLILDENAWFVPDTEVFYNVSLKNGACLDFNNVSDSFILGNFNGSDSLNQGTEPGILVLKSDGNLNITGEVTGKTILKAANKNVASIFFNEWTYIWAEQKHPEEANFILSDIDMEHTNFMLEYIDGGWTVYHQNAGESVEIGSIEITSSPSAVDVNTILEQDDGTIPNENAFCEVIWRDENGTVISNEIIEENMFYDFSYVIGIKTDYWKSEDPSVLDLEDWSNFIQFISSDEHPGKYYFTSFAEANTGDYTFLFCSQPFSDHLNTVADVKALKNTVKAECRVIFFDSSDTENPPSVHTHTYEETITEAPTCIKEGKKTVSCTFAGCGESYTAVIAKTAHLPVDIPMEPPTCSQMGKTSGKRCSVCDTVMKPQKEIPKTAHTEVTDPAQAPTCGTDGKTEGIHCGVCSTVIKAQTTIPKTGSHTETEDPAEDPTCEKEGKTAGSHCSVCHTILQAQNVIPKLSHEYTEQVIKEATCSNPGEKTLTCRNCNESHTEEIPKTPHTEVEDPAEEATCTKPGKTKGSHCSVCLAVIQIQKSVPQKAHDYKTQAVKASLQKNGYSKTECSQCGKVLHEHEVYAPKSIVLSSEHCVYNGTNQYPAVTVKDSKGRFVEPKYYTVLFRNHKEVGLAEVQVTFRDLYEGILTRSFKILPKPTAIQKIAATGREVTVKWKKQKKQTSGYLIQYSTGKKFTAKTTKTVKVKKSKTVSKKIGRLKAGKKYFVRICTYKTVKDGGKKVDLCSPWSKVKSVKISR